MMKSMLRILARPPGVKPRYDKHNEPFFFLRRQPFIYLCVYLAVLGLHCRMFVFSTFGWWRLLFVAVRGLLIAVASPVAEHGL